MSRFAYYMRFLLNLLSFCAIANFLIMISVWLLRKCSNRINIVLGFYLVWLGFGHLLYIAIWASFFSPPPPPPPPKKKKKSIWLLKEIEFKLESQINYIVGKRKQKHLNFYNIIRLHVWDLLWSFSQNFTLYDKHIWWLLITSYALRIDFLKICNKFL